MRQPRLHPAWLVAGVAFLALFAAAGFRGAPGALLIPLEHEFGWSMSTMSLAVSVNLILYGLVSPFAAALMDRYGIRRVVSVALFVVALGAVGSTFITASWQLIVFWGVLIGGGTGSMALVLAATITNRWFTERRGLVMGILTAGQATGQLAILPPVAAIAENIGWRWASLLIAAVALAVIPLAAWLLRDFPEDRGAAPFGEDSETWQAPVRQRGGAAKRAIDGLFTAAKSPVFWALAIAFAICGATTNGLIGLSLMALPWLLSDSIHVSMLIFIVIYGLDWVATVPPTMALCNKYFGDQATIVFGWVFAAHQIGAAFAAFGAGVIRDTFGEYTYAWWGGAAVCGIAVVLSLLTKQRPAVRTAVAR